MSGSLRLLLDNSVDHERVPDQVDRRLTVAAWAGLGLLVVQLLLLWEGSAATDGLPTWPVVAWAFTGFGHPVAAMIVTGLILAGSLGLAVATRGFRRAATRGQSGQLALMGAGAVAAVPVAWVVIVLVAIVVAVVVGAIVLCWLFIAMLEG